MNLRTLCSGGKKDAKSFSRAERSWLLWFGAVSVAIHCGFGMSGTVFGPTQPFIACNIGSDPAEISVVWSFQGVGWMIGSIASSAYFKSYIRESRHKLIYFSSVVTVAAVFSGLVPFVKSLAALCAVKFLAYLFGGSFAAVNIAHFVYTMGPIKSRPFTMMVHLLVGVGFFVGSLIVRPFLPDKSMAESGNSNDVCQSIGNVENVIEETTNNNNSTCEFENTVETLAGLPSIYWPYIIMSCIVLLSALSFLPLALLTKEESFKMPVYNEEDEGKGKKKEDFKRLFKWLPLLILVFLFYCLSCGIERIFQSTVFTFGLCGPLQLPAKSAALSDNSYNGGFMVGRFLGTLIAAFVCPRNMLSLSVSVNFAAAVVLTLFASSSAEGLYAGSAMIGFAVSWQYGSAFSWTAQKLDVTGIAASLFAASCGIGGMSFVPLAGFLNKTNPMAMIWIVLGFTIAHLLIWIAMWITARVLKRRESAEEEKTQRNIIEMTIIDEL